MSSKLAEIYLAIASAFYIIVGIGVLIPLASFNYLATVFASFGTAIGAIPRIVIATMPFPWNTTPYIFRQAGQPEQMGFGPIISILAFIAIVLGVLAFISLVKIKNNQKWIRSWYFISILSIIIFLTNEYPFRIYSLFLEPFQLIYPLLICLSTYLLYRGMQKNALTQNV